MTLKTGRIRSPTKFISKNGLKFPLKGKVKRTLVKRNPLEELFELRYIEAVTDDRVAWFKDSDMVLGETNVLDESSNIRLAPLVNLARKENIDETIAKLQEMGVRFLQLDDMGGGGYRVLNMYDPVIKRHIQNHLDKATQQNDKERKSTRERKTRVIDREIGSDETYTAKDETAKSSKSSKPTKKKKKQSPPSPPKKPKKAKETVQKRNLKTRKVAVYNVPNGLPLDLDPRTLPVASSADFKGGLVVKPEELELCDIICGRGQQQFSKGSFVGTKLFRRYVWRCKELYQHVEKGGKRKIALHVLWKLRQHKPIPRFVVQDGQVFKTMSYDLIINKTTQALREKKWSHHSGYD